MAGWFANVRDTKRIAIPEIGGWIEVRNELTVGERRGMLSRAFKGDVTLITGETRHDYDPTEMSFAQTIAYLAAWGKTKVDEHDPDKPEDLDDVTMDALRALKAEVYNPIERAIQKHISSLRKNEQSSPETPRRRGGLTSRSVTT